MNSTKLQSLMVFLILLFSFNGFAQDKNTSTKAIAKNRVEVINFHSTRRCFTCNTIETNTKYALANYFANEMKAGKITHQSINVEEEKNFKLAEKFEASGTALFLNVVVNGKEKQIDLTDFAFMKGTKQKVFAKELKNKIEAQLKNL